MPTHLSVPTRISVPGGKLIDEYVGRANSATTTASVAQMRSPGGWTEPAQTPEFDEVTLVLHGTVRVQHDSGTIEVRAGEAVLTRAGERVRYSTPDPDGAEYVAVCLPAFAAELAHREGDQPRDSRVDRCVDDAPTCSDTPSPRSSA